MKTLYYVHELNDVGEVIETTPCDNLHIAREARKELGKKPARVERVTLNAEGRMINKEDVT